MRVIIAGGRANTKYETVVEAVLEATKVGITITEIFEGGCTGSDRLARKYAQEHSIPYRTFEANWKQYGLNAGPIRNKNMVKEGDALIALWDGQTRGTGDIIKQAKKKGIPVVIFKIPGVKERRGRPKKT